MTQQRLSGPGLGLPYPQSLYPAFLIGSSPQAATNEFVLAPGQALPVPPGDWAVSASKGLAALQVLDPVTTMWGDLQPLTGENKIVHSDGQNIRFANLTGCPVSATVTARGTSGYTTTGTTVTASAGGSTWVAVVGGAVNTSVTITSAGSGYTIAPLVLFSAPASPGVQATGYATISSGAVASVVVTNQGAGYLVAPTITVLPSPYDPNFGSIVNAVLTATLTGAGQVTAVLCTNSGAPQSSAPTLTVAGGDGTATATANMLWTATGASVTAGGGGYTTVTKVTSVGGLSSATPIWTNPRTEGGILLKPRSADMAVAASGGAITSISAVYDGGLYTGTPTTLVVSNAVVTTAATLALTLGSAVDTVMVQPL